MGWVGVTHVRRYHEHYHSRGGGHLYQGRFKSFPVAEDDYFLALCRYVEANALRTGLVERAEEWQWGGLWQRAHGPDELPLSPWPLERSRNWVAWVNRGLNDEQLAGIRTCVQRDRPFGPRRGCGRRRCVWGLSSRFAAPAGHEKHPIISNVPFSCPPRSRPRPATRRHPIISDVPFSCSPFHAHHPTIRQFTDSRPHPYLRRILPSGSPAQPSDM